MFGLKLLLIFLSVASLAKSFAVIDPAHGKVLYHKEFVFVTWNDEGTDQSDHVNVELWKYEPADNDSTSPVYVALLGSSISVGQGRAGLYVYPEYGLGDQFFIIIRTEVSQIETRGDVFSIQTEQVVLKRSLKRSRTVRSLS
ncbi:hypothetical protein K7432_012371 [Basidiobolus ranarum]|uniref:Uncharacterized protein n=1 Tax=Basidiobolus ranarum TaxID=34480 RepID=A0ABR2WKU8_9FUNG